MRPTAILLGLAVLSSAAQRPPALFLSLDDSGRLHAWLSLPAPMPESTGRAFARAMNCPTPPASEPWRSSGAHVDCAAAINKEGLRWSTHWDLTALAGELRRSGADALQIDITHSRSGFSRVEPPLSETQGDILIVSHRGQVPLGDLHGLTLEAGVEQSQIWRVAATAAFILLLPLLLLPLRRSPLLLLAASHGLFVVAATAWLWALLPLHAAMLVPLSWYLALVWLPMAVAVWTGSRMAGAARRRAFLWRGIIAVALLTLIIGIFTAPSNVIPWCLSSVAAILIAVWRLRRGGKRLRLLLEGELLEHARQLAARAGTTVKSVQLIAGGEDLPAAFATRFRDILLTRGLLAAFSRREVDAIVGHELSHLRRPINSAGRTGVFLLTGALILAFLVPSSLEWLPLLLPPLFLLQRANRRRKELIADADAVSWCGDAEALVTGLARVTRLNGMPLDWPRWVQPVMPHPPTLQRVRAIGLRAAIPEARLQELLTAPDVSPADRYPIPQPPQPGTALTPEARKHLNTVLTLVALVIPVAFGVASLFLGYAAALLLGAATSVLLPEWILWRTRARARRLLPGRAGLFCGFSPSDAPRVYDGSYDYDWGFAAFEDGALLFRGDRGSWSVNRSEVAQIWLTPGPFNWMPRPAVCFRLINGASLSLRPFDRAFGPAAPRAAAAFLRQAAGWHTDASAESPAAGHYDFASVQGQPPPPYTWRTLLRSLPIYALVTFAIQWTILAALPGSQWSDPLRLVGPPAVSAALTAFMAYPGVRRGRQSGPSPSVAPQSHHA
jgi:Zn-dependent protease with chaperone function